MPENEALLSICIIVKDEEKNLSLTLPGLISGADQVVLVDTGSSDKTVTLAENLGAEVHFFEWQNDFSAARNFSISQARSRWIMWVDADEYIRPEDLKSLREILKNSEENSYQVYIRECDYGGFEGRLYYWRTKIFRNLKGIHFSRTINEQLFDKDEQPVTGPRLDLSIYHWGNRAALDAEKFQAKKNRNILALKQALAANPEDPLFNYLMGVNLREIEEFYQAAGYFDEAIKFSSDKSFQYDALVARGWCFFGLRLYREAEFSLDRAMAIFPWRPEAMILKGTILILHKEFQKAVDLFEAAPVFSISETDAQLVDLNNYYCLPNSLLGEAYLNLGQLRKGLESYKKAFRFHPDDRMGKKIEVLEMALASGIEYYPAAQAVSV